MANDPAAVIPDIPTEMRRCPKCNQWYAAVSVSSFVNCDLCRGEARAYKAAAIEMAGIIAERDQLRVDSENYHAQCGVCCTACCDMLGEDVCVACERDRLLFVAGLLEQASEFIRLPHGRPSVFRRFNYTNATVKWGVMGGDDEYPTALAAIRAGMGWDREEKS